MTRRTKAASTGYKAIKVERESLDIFGGLGSKLFTLLRKAVGGNKAESNTSNSIGEREDLIDKVAARELRDFNSTHAICIDAKVSSSVGMGHRDQDIHKKLNPLTRFGWQDVLDALGEDYSETGECFLEMAFNDPDNPLRVTGLFHVESAAVTPMLERENSEALHYQVVGEVGYGEVVIMAQAGDLAGLKERHGLLEDGEERADLRLDANESAPMHILTGTVRNSELLHIRQATNRCRYRGYPDYMSAVPSIELVQCMTQHEFDFYFNRGVPEFLLFLFGRNVGTAWGKIENMIRANQGPGNSQKTGAVHIPGNIEESKVQIEKLAMEDAGNSGFAEKSGTLDMRIATAHGMPPQLANIALPGKIGGANEGPNAMLTFQKRKLGRIQKNFSNAFACAFKDLEFGQPDGEVVKLTEEQFLGSAFGPLTDEGVPQYVEPGNGFATILDGMTLGAMETMNTMREPLAGSGRDLNKGKLGGTDERTAGDPRATR